MYHWQVKFCHYWLLQCITFSYPYISSWARSLALDWLQRAYGTCTNVSNTTHTLSSTYRVIIRYPTLECIELRNFPSFPYTTWRQRACYFENIPNFLTGTIVCIIDILNVIEHKSSGRIGKEFQSAVTKLHRWFAIWRKRLLMNGGKCYQQKVVNHIHNLHCNCILKFSILIS